MIDDILKNAKTRMDKSNEALDRDLAGVRTGRASPGLVEHLKVDYYGALTPLGQIASVSAPDARLLVIQPWDKTALPNIEKAILKSDLGLNPSNDGNLLRLSIPPLSEDRRKDLVKSVRKRLEDGKVELRNLRREALEALRDAEKNKEISKDDLQRSTDQLQKTVDESVKEADEIGKRKEQELMEV